METLRLATTEEKMNAPYQVSGLLPSPKNPKDWFYAQKIDMTAGDLPSATNNARPDLIFDQAQKGSCTGNAGAYHKGFQERPSHNGQWLVFSRDFLYTLAQTLDGIEHTKPGYEEGSNTLGIMKTLQQYGVCLESTLTYNPDPKAKVAIPQQAYTEALNYRIKNYAKLQVIDEMKHALAQGKTIMSGLIVTDSFMHPETGGFCGLPLGTIYGGHEILLVDYDDDMTHTYSDGHTEKGFFLFPNSWGDGWGDKGYGKLPYSFLDFINKDFGSHFFMEAWTSVDLDSDPVPPPVLKTKIEIWEGKTTAMVSGNPVALDQSAIEQNGRVLVPIRFVSESLGCQVDWDPIEKKVTIED